MTEAGNPLDPSPPPERATGRPAGAEGPRFGGRRRLGRQRGLASPSESCSSGSEALPELGRFPQRPVNGDRRRPRRRPGWRSEGRLRAGRPRRRGQSLTLGDCRGTRGSSAPGRSRGPRPELLVSTRAFKTFPAGVQANIDGGRQAVLRQSPGRTPPHGAGEGKGVLPEEGGPERDGRQQRLRRRRGSPSPTPDPPPLKTKGFYSPRKKETPEMWDPRGRGGGTSILPPPKKTPKVFEQLQRKKGLVRQHTPQSASELLPCPKKRLRLRI